MHWSQNYTPLGGIGLSALVAAIPVIILLGLLAFWHVRAHLAALIAPAAAAAIAIFVYHMPATLTLAAAGYGAAFGLLPIGWLILNAIFIYQLSVETGQFAVLQTQIAGVSGDRRIQALLLAFCFGAVIEGAAGFGAPVAISGALMIGLGFKPLEAAKLALIGNTAPVAFGSLGIPITTLAPLTGLDVLSLSAMVGRQLPFFSLLVPFWLVAAQAGWRGMIAVWPACLVAGASFGTMQFLVSNFHGPWLVDIISAAFAMLAVVILMRFWQPAQESRNPTSPASPSPPGLAPAPAAALSPHTSSLSPAPASPVRAWLPWISLTVFVFIWGLPQVKSALNALFAPEIPVPFLHLGIEKMPPVAPKPTPEKALFVLNLLSATGTALLLAGIAASIGLGVSFRRALRIYWRTLLRVRMSMLTISLMMALGFTTRYSGTDTTMGLALAQTGWLFPFFSPLIGWLGVALTGSDTSSNVLFGNLQKVTAEQLGFSPILTCAANSSGGVMGKMIDAQSIVVASVATGGHPESPAAGTILRAVFWHSITLAVLVGCLVMLQAYVWPGMIPPLK
ncbi:MAG: lactate permease LctP family transporter [Undibacterium sp.]|nr:lactate permease LctP family transporter [Opitutaceae bacterium]